MDSNVKSTTTNLFVGNLPFSVDDRELRDLFAPFGEVTRAVVGINRDTGQSKGFGFVAFADRKSAEVSSLSPAFSLEYDFVLIDIGNRTPWPTWLART